MAHPETYLRLSTFISAQERQPDSFDHRLRRAGDRSPESMPAIGVKEESLRMPIASDWIPAPCGHSPMQTM